MSRKIGLVATHKFDEPAAGETKAHPYPTEATVKRLYASAFRCAKPECSRPLYRVDGNTGDLILNSRIAHIHARSPGGPRWVEMSSEDNRNITNLVLLCIEHSHEVDDFPDNYPADVLRQWKKSQFDEHQRINRGWPLTDSEAGQAIGASFQTLDHHHAGAILEVVRVAERVILAARDARRGPAVQAGAWRAAKDRARVSVGWDHNGNTIYAEPSALETRQCREALEQALALACEKLAPVVNDLKIELAAALASRSSIEPWTSWVSSAAEEVIVASGSWPITPELNDNDHFESTLENLSVARNALTAAWRGEQAQVPPPEPEKEIPEVERDLMKEHLDLLERARPYSRVAHLPYNEGLRAELVQAASAAASIPPVFSALTLGLDATCMHAVAVSANAGDDLLTSLVEEDAKSRPLSVAFFLLAETFRTSKRHDRPVIQQHAESALLSLWENVDWSDLDSWDTRDLNLRNALSIAASVTSPLTVEETLANAIHQNPDVLLALVAACGEWVEEHDSSISEVRGFRRRYRTLPQWFPTNAIVAASGTVQQVSVDSFGETVEDSPEALFSQILWIAGRGSK